MTRDTPNDYRIMSKAVREWYRYYEVEWDDQASSFLCDAAIELYDHGGQSVEEMATINREVCRARRYSHHAPSSDSVHCPRRKRAPGHERSLERIRDMWRHSSILRFVNPIPVLSRTPF